MYNISNSPVHTMYVATHSGPLSSSRHPCGNLASLMHCFSRRQQARGGEETRRRDMLPSFCSPRSLRHRWLGRPRWLRVQPSRFVCRSFITHSLSVFGSNKPECTNKSPIVLYEKAGPVVYYIVHMHVHKESLLCT